MAELEGGKRLILSNDDDFGIPRVKGVLNAESKEVGPWTLIPKIQPATGKQDDGEYLEINMQALPAGTSTATVTLNVNGVH